MKKITSLFFVIILLSFGCKNKKDATNNEKHETLAEDIVELNADQIKIADIEYGTIEQKTLSNTLNVSGMITVPPQNMASVCVPLGGFIKSTKIKTGDLVKKGQPLAIIENQEFIEIQRNYLESRNKLDFAESEYQRHNDLYKNDVYSKQNVQQVTAEYKNLKAQVNASAQKLALIGIDPSRIKDNNITRSVPIPAPISGFIKSVNINIGKYVNPSDVMFEIVNTSNLTLELTLFEKDINKIKTGQKLNFSIANSNNKEFKATISQTGKAVGNDKTIKVYATVLSTGLEKALPGMYVNARIETTSNPVTALPSNAIVRFDGKDFIFVYSKSKEEGKKTVTEFKMIEVKRGVTNDNYTEVILPQNFDLKNNKIVIKGAYTLLSAKKNAGDMAC